MHQGIHNTCSIYGGERKSDQDFESGLVFLMSKREKQSLCLISMRREQSKAMAQPIAYTKARTCSNQAASISALLDCVSTYLLNQGYSSEGQERRYVKAKKQSVAETAVPACVVPPSFLAKGNREEREVV
jgi:hypothetical protein